MQITSAKSSSRYISHSSHLLLGNASRADAAHWNCRLLLLLLLLPLLLLLHLRRRTLLLLLLLLWLLFY
jgi:hypothetical protein